MNEGQERGGFILSLCKAILVTEDNDDTRELLVLVLENAGYRVVSAANGAEALQKLRMLNTPTLILLDMMMPVMSGWDFLKDKTRQGHKVITISAVHEETLDDLGEWGGVEARIQKPLFADDVLGLVKKFCEPIEPQAHSKTTNSVLNYEAQ